MAKSRARKLADIIVGAGVDIDGNLTFSGGSTSDDLTFADNDKANFGTSSDLQIYHDGTNSYIKDAGAGELIIQARDAVTIEDGATGDNYIYMQRGNKVALYYDGASKFETFSGGVSVTGQVNATTMHLPDGSTGLQLGSSNDTKFFHDGANSKITHSGSGGFYIGADTLGLQTGAHTENYLTAAANGAVSLYYDNSAKLATATGGITVTGETSTTTLASGNSTMTGLVQIGNSSGGTLLFKRPSANYIFADQTGGYLVFGTNGRSTSIANSNFYIGADQSSTFVGSVSFSDSITASAPITINGSGSEDRYLQFGLDGRSSAFTGQNAAFIFCGQGGSGDFLAGGLYLQSRSATAGREIGFITGTTPAKRMIIDSSGNVGIDPSSGYTLTDKLTVRGSQSQLRIQDSSVDAKGVSLLYSNSNNYGQLICDHRGNNQLNFYYSALNHYFGRNTSSSYLYMTLTDTGELGLGTTSPFAKSHIVDTSWSSGAPYGTVQLIEGNNVNDNNWGHLVVTDTTTTSGNGGAISFATGASNALNPFAGIKGVSEGTSYGGIGLFTRANGGTATQRMHISSTGTTTLTSADSLLLKLNPTANNYGGIVFQYNGVNKGTSIFNSGMMVYGGESEVNTALQAGGQYGLFIHHSTRNVGIGTGTSAPGQKLTVGSGHIKLDEGYSLQWSDSHERIEQSDGHLEFFVNNGEAMTLDTNGLGIGITAPAAKLHVNYGVNASVANLAEVDNYSPVRFGSFRADNDDNLYFMSVGGGKVGIQSRDSTASGAARILSLNPYGGNVGIGTNSPSHKLDVYSSERFPLRVHRTSSDLSDTQGVGIGFSLRGDTNTSTSDTRAAIMSKYNGDFYIAVDSGGNLNTTDPIDEAALFIEGGNKYVGIGTTSPAQKLHVKAGASGATTFDSRYNTIIEDDGENYLALYSPNNSYGGVRFINADNSIRGAIDYYHGTQGDKLQAYAQNEIVFQYPTYGIQHTFKKAGNVGIRASNAPHDLTIHNASGPTLYLVGGSYNDDVRIAFGGGDTTNTSGNGNTGAQIISTQSAINGQARGNLQFKTNGGDLLQTRLVIEEAGNVGIGTTNPNSTLTVAGNIEITGTNRLLLPNFWIGPVPNTANNNNGAVLLVNLTTINTNNIGFQFSGSIIGNSYTGQAFVNVNIVKHYTNDNVAFDVGDDQNLNSTVSRMQLNLCTITYSGSSYLAIVKNGGGTGTIFLNGYFQGWYPSQVTEIASGTYTITTNHGNLNH